MNTGSEPQVRKLTVDDYYLLAKDGNFDPDERTELADGQIIKMFPIGFKHSNAQASLLRQFFRQEDPALFKVGPEAYVSVALVNAIPIYRW
jgi:Uma2 family endonuclease